MNLKNLFKRNNNKINKFDNTFKQKVFEAFKEKIDPNIDIDHEIYKLYEINILKQTNYNALNEYLYYTIRELYLIDIPNPICYLIGCNKQTKNITYSELLNSVTRIKY